MVKLDTHTHILPALSAGLVDQHAWDLTCCSFNVFRELAEMGALGSLLNMLAAGNGSVTRRAGARALGKLGDDPVLLRRMAEPGAAYGPDLGNLDTCLLDNCASSCKRCMLSRLCIRMYQDV